MASRVSGRCLVAVRLEIECQHPAARSAPSPWPRLAAEDERLVPPLGAQGVVGEPLDLLRQPVAVEPLDLLDDSSVDGAPAIGEETAVGHLLRQRVLERVLRLRKEARL